MIRLVTFNLRCPAAGDGDNYFPYRLPGILDTLAAQSPDVIGFQEMTDSIFEAMPPMTPAYAYAGTGRNADLTGEGCRVAYRKDRLTLCATDTFWLSPTPLVPGSRYENQSSCPRVCTWVKLWDKAGGGFFYFVNTHLDHESEEARVLGLRLVLDTAEALKRRHDIPLFISGDFNCLPGDRPCRLIAEYGLHDLTAGISGTYHGYSEREDEKIDYLLTDQPRERFAVRKWHKSRFNTYLSDHDVVAADWDIG